MRGLDPRIHGCRLQCPYEALGWPDRVGRDGDLHTRRSLPFGTEPMKRKGLGGWKLPTSRLIRLGLSLDRRMHGADEQFDGIGVGNGLVRVYLGVW